MDEVKKLKQLVTDFTKTVNDSIDKINNRIVELEKENKKNEGVVIDYKTFSNIVNALSYGVSTGVTDKELYDQILAIGRKQMFSKEIIKQNESMAAKKCEFKNKPSDFQSLDPEQLIINLLEEISKSTNSPIKILKFTKEE